MAEVDTVKTGCTLALQDFDVPYYSHADGSTKAVKIRQSLHYVSLGNGIIREDQAKQAALTEAVLAELSAVRAELAEVRAVLATHTGAGDPAQEPAPTQEGAAA